jgi:hypothetical protein
MDVNIKRSHLVKDVSIRVDVRVPISNLTALWSERGGR